MTNLAAVALMLWATGGQQPSTTGPTVDLAAARAMYANGNYEDALSRLPAASSDAASIAEVNEYRALCLLALGRPTEAQRALEDLVIRQPLFKMSDTDMSPRLVAMFRDIRRRLLPDAAKDVYAKAKRAFDHQQYDDAATGFRGLLTLINDEDMAPSAASVADLKLLGEGFLTLSEKEAAAARAAAAAAPPASTAPPGAADGSRTTSDPPSPSAPPAFRIYSDDDKAVEPPVEISAPYPSWHPAGAAAAREYKGVLRIVIDEQGRVESAALVVPVAPAYDSLLLAAVKKWTFKPAQLDGTTVKYQRLIAITLLPH
jgi:TonB family protein